MNLFGDLGGIENMLNFHVKRHGVLASNMANAETPGYQAKDLQKVHNFGGQLASAQQGLATTQSGHIAPEGNQTGGGEVVELEQAPSVDGNGVQKDHTLAQVTANRLRYEQGLDIIRRRLAITRYGATDGGG